MQFRLYRAYALPALLLLAIGCGPKAAPAGEGDDKSEGAAVAVETSPVSVRLMRSTIQAQGIFVAPQGGSVKVGAVSAGRIAKILVVEGDQVQPNQLVAVLDNKISSAQAQSAAAALSMAESTAKQSVLNAKSSELEQASNLKIALLAQRSAKAEREANIRLATLNLASAQVALTRATAGNRRQEVAQAEQAVRQAQVTRDSAARDEKRNELLLEKGIVSQKTYDDSKTALANADASLKSAQAQFDIVKEGTRSEDIESARLAMQSAKQALKSAKEVGDQKVEQAEEGLRQAQQAILQVQAKRLEVEANQKSVLQKSADAGAAVATQALTEIRSPIAGRVARRLLNPGDTPDNTNPILEIVSESSGLDFNASLPPTDATNLAPNQIVLITTAGSEAKEVSGVVLSVGLVDPQTGLLSVRIHCSKPPQIIKPGTFGTARIIVSQNANALVVPKQAVLAKDNDAIVYVVKGDKASMIKIQTGSEEDGFVEVKKGLDKSQTVITLGNYELSDGSPIKLPDEKKEGGKTEGDKDEKPTGAKDK